MRFPFVLLAVLSLSPTLWRSGVASWYSPKPKHVKMYGTRLLAAHRTLRPTTKVRIRRGKKSVDVIICGRGPFIKGRTFDLSREAFSKLADPKKGVIKVQWRVIRQARKR